MNNITPYEEFLKRDLKFGLAEEDRLIHLFREKFDKLLCKTGDFSVMDFISPKTYLELKSRNVKHDTYNSVMIGANKIKFARDCGKRVIFVFNFTDGIYYYEFKYEDTRNGVIDFRLGGRMDRGIDERKTYAYININNIVKLE